MLNDISASLLEGASAFKAVAPGPSHLVKARWLRFTLKCVPGVIRLVQGKTTLADELGSRLGAAMLSPLTKRVASMYVRAAHVKMKAGRSWFTPEVENGRAVHKLVVVFHDANKAGKHLDVHIGRWSFIYRISGKPVEALLRYNKKGELTQASKDALIEHLRGEIRNHSRTPQNLDHSISNARMVWNKGEGTLTGYGSGETRQIVLEDDVEFYHKHIRSSLHLYAPALFPDQGTYLYKVYHGKDTGVPVAIWGTLIPRDESYEDRLHLKLIQEVDFDEKFIGKVDVGTVTRKYDGASTYFSTTGQGFKFFSPRHSKLTGHRVEYTYKVPELAETGFGPVWPDRVAHTVGMGELMFWRRTPFGRRLSLFGMRGPEGLAWQYLSAAEMGGILNSNKVRMLDVYPEVRIYRMDKYLGTKTHDLPFWENRALQEAVATEMDSDYWKVVELMHPTINRSHEGLVAVPPNQSVNNGMKVKWWGDTYDWEVISVDLKIGPKGAVAGVVRFKSLESGKHFKLGPGQIGSADDCLDMMDNPEEYVGKVAKIASRLGHEGRSSKLVDWHLDK